MTVRNSISGGALVVGLCFALARWGWQPLLAFAVTVGFILFVIVAVVTEGATRPGRLVVAGLVAGVVPCAAAGFVAVLGWAGVLVVLALLGLAASALPARPRLPKAWRRSSADTRPSWEDPDPAQEMQLGTTSLLVLPGPDAKVLDDAELCLAWRRSFVRLEAAASTVARLAIVQERETYLDELQRRHAQGFATWLRAGARASGNPLPYLKAGSGGPRGPGTLRDDQEPDRQ
jgi:hypothetical protein